MASRIRLSEIAEQRVVRYGIRRLRREIVGEGADLPALPRRPNGTSRLVQRSFFERLLAGQVELKSSLASDVSSAQPDLKHLALEHLLVLRDSSSDFNTDSKNYEGHQAFLEQLDRWLQGLLAERQLEPAQVSGSSQLKQQLGRLAVFTSGAAALLSGQAPGAEDFASAAGPAAVPSLWLLPLPAEAFPDHAALLLRTQEPVPQLHERSTRGGYASATPSTAPSSSESSPKAEKKDVEEPELSSPSLLRSGPKMALLSRPAALPDLEVLLDLLGPGEAAGVVWDRSSGSGKVRRLCWEVAVLRGDHVSAEQLLVEMASAERGAAMSAAGVGGSAGLASPLGKELAETLRRRATAPVIPKLV